jgi:hypothetical protein
MLFHIDKIYMNIYHYETLPPITTWEKINYQNVANKNSLLKTHIISHDAYCEVKENISIIKSKFNYNMQNKHTNEKYDVMNL